MRCKLAISSIASGIILIADQGQHRRNNSSTMYVYTRTSLQVGSFADD